MRSAIVAAAVVLVVGGAAWRFWPTDARRVRGRIDAVADIINEPAREGIAGVGRAAHLANFFTDDVLLDLGARGGRVQGRQQLVALASRPPSAGRPFRLSLADVTVDIAGQDRATARLIATLATADEQSGEEYVDAHDVELQFRRSDDWRINRITLLDTLERPEP